jgi:hypothetical protein
MNYAVSVICETCKYSFTRYTKYLSETDKIWMLHFCCFFCYQQSPKYYQDHKFYILEKLQNYWWNPEC